MKKIILGIAIVVLGSVALVYGMGDLYVSGTWRYKVTVEIETPEGIKTGSAVRQVSNSDSSLYINLPDVGNPSNFKGEAVVIDLGKRGIVFATLGSTPSGEFYSAFPYTSGKKLGDGIRYYNSLPVGTKGHLTKYTYPKFVMFEDINDPKSVSLVYNVYRLEESTFNNPKYITTDHFEELFGEGVRLKNISYEISNEKVTWKIDSYLPSFGEETGFMEWFRKLKYGSPLRVAPYHFKQENF